MVLLLAGGGYTRRQGLRRIKERLQNVPGTSAVRYEPSSVRPRTVVAEVAIEILLGRAFPREQARIEITWRPREEVDVQRVHWIDDEVSLGWHKDDDHPGFGTTHFQIDTGDELRHEEGRIEAEAPLAFLERCLERLPGRLEETT